MSAKTMAIAEHINGFAYTDISFHTTSVHCIKHLVLVFI